MNQIIAEGNRMIAEARRKRTVAKRAENKLVKALLKKLGYEGIQVSHTTSNWLDIKVEITTPSNCFCIDVPRNMGRCSNCSNAWSEAYAQIKTEAQAKTERKGEYDGYIQVMIRLI